MIQKMKDNLVLTLGLALPVLLIVFFYLATTIPNMLVAEPQHDFLFVDMRNGYGYSFKVENGKLFATYTPQYYYGNQNKPRIYRFIAKTQKSEVLEVNLPDPETIAPAAPDKGTAVIIPIDPTKLPSEEQAADASKIASQVVAQTNKSNRPVTVAILENLTVDDSETAEDGYSFKNSGYSYSGDFMIPMGGGSRWHGPVLTKSGKVVQIKYANADRYHNTQFLGWVK